MLLKSRASPDMLLFSLCNKKRLAIRHMNRPLFPTTLSIPSCDIGKKVGLRLYQHPLVQLYSPSNLGARWWVGDQGHASAALPSGKTRYPLYRRLVRPQGPYMYSVLQTLCYNYYNYSVKYIATVLTDCYITLYMYVLMYCCHYT